MSAPSTIAPPRSPVPPRRAGTHIWPILVGGLVPMGLLTAYRLFVSRGLAPTADPTQLWRTCADHLVFWSAWIAASLALVRLVPWRAAGLVRILFHSATALIAGIEVLDLSFTQVTGTRVDWDALLALLQAAPQTLPVLLSEVQPLHVGALAIAILATVGALRWRPKQTVAWPPALALWLGLLGLPAFDLLSPTSSPKAPLRAISTQIFDHLWTTGQERLGDVETAPEPGSLDPLQVARSPAWRAPNIVLVTLESTNVDQTSLYNPALSSTPNLAALARDGLAIRDLYALVPHTSKALVTILCGQTPRLDAPITEAQVGGLPGRCLPELLAAEGYRTAYFQTAREDFEDRFRLVHNLRFDLFRAAETLPQAGYDKVNYFGREDLAMLGPGLEWSAQEPERPFFATYVTLTSHHDYGTPVGWPASTLPGGDAAANKHLSGVNYVDHFLGQLIEGYRQAGLLDNTLFIILGDHGEGFGEHGRFQHDLVIHEEGLHVPGVLYGPGVLGDRRGWIEGNRDQRDILPTVLDVVGLWPTSGYLPGRSLFTAPDPQRVIRHSCWRSLRCLAERQGTEKFIDLYKDAPPRLYHLDADPHEKTGERPADVAARRARLRDWRAGVNGRATALRSAALDRLRSRDDRPAQAAWEGGMELVGCRPQSTEATIGEGLWLTCRWRAARPLNQGWKLRATVEIKGQRYVTTAPPTQGAIPTWQWAAGEVIEDELRVTVPRGAPTGNATVTVGWTSLGGRAVAALEGPDAVEVARITLRNPSSGQSFLPPGARRPLTSAAPQPHTPQP